MPDNVTLKDIYQAINDLREEMGQKYVTKDEFWPVKAIVYGGAGLVLMGVATILLTLALRQ